MSNSGLATVKVMSPNYSKRTKSICGVAIHCMAGNLSAKACGDLFAKSSTEASSNYGIDSDGVIGLYVDEANRSWCTSSEGVDSRAVTIEVANNKEGNPWPISDKAYNSLINLLVDICVRNNIKSLKWEASKSYGVSFKTDKQNMWAHRWFANKTCPGDYLYSRFGTIASEVNARLNSLSSSEKQEIIKSSSTGIPYKTTTTAGSSAYSKSVSSNTTSTTKTKANVKMYIATIDRNTSRDDFSKFSKNDIVGVVIEAGYLFDSNHNKVEFQNPKIDAQISAAAKQSIPYGFYFTARAKNVQEIKEEIYQLSFVIRKYPPKLGVWMALGLTGTVSANDTLVDEYYNRLKELGLFQQVGIYATATQFKTITWSKHYDEWWLWLNKHYTKDTEFKNSISSSIFKVPEDKKTTSKGK